MVSGSLLFYVNMMVNFFIIFLCDVSMYLFKLLLIFLNGLLFSLLFFSVKYNKLLVLKKSILLL